MEGLAIWLFDHDSEPARTNPFLTQQSALALGVATLGTLFLSLVPHQGVRDALGTTLLVQLGLVVLTGLLSLRLPRAVG